MAGEVAPPGEAFAAICACKSLYGAVAPMPLHIIGLIW